MSHDCNEVQTDYGNVKTPQNFRKPSTYDSGLIGDINSIQSGILRDIVIEYLDIFSKSNYDVGMINIQPQRVFLKSDLPIVLDHIDLYSRRKGNF